MTLDLEAHWAAQHRQQNRYWLSHTTPSEVLTFHDVARMLVEPGRRVIDVGVGTGVMAAYLRSTGTVDRLLCVDLVPEAQSAVAEFCDQFTLTSELQSCRPFGADLAVCHLVTQHCDDDAVVALLAGLLRNLKPTGILSVQFAAPYMATMEAYPQKQVAKGHEPVQKTLDEGLLKLRWASDFEQLVHKAGGQVQRYVAHKTHWKEGAIRWHVCHVKRATPRHQRLFPAIYSDGRVKLSLLIPTLPGRLLAAYTKLLGPLQEQVEGKAVELLYLGDNCQRSVGDKRNALLQMSRGEFLAFIDDDDQVAPDYVDAILAAIAEDPQVDLVTFDHLCHLPAQTVHCRYSLDHLEASHYDGEGNWTGAPPHTACWRSSIAKEEVFRSIDAGEDADWARRVASRVRTHTNLERVLYHYHALQGSSETREPVLCPPGPTSRLAWRPDIDPVKPKILHLAKKRPRLRASVAMSTYNKGSALRRTLRSVFRQRPPFLFEVVVVDHGSTDDTREVCCEFIQQGWPLRYEFLPSDKFCNPAPARNLAYKLSHGEIIIAQSDEVVHHQGEPISMLVESLRPGTFAIATVWDCPVDDNLEPYDFHTRIQYTGPQTEQGRRPLFFLGAIYRRDVYAIGGNCELFARPGYEDDWFAQCLTNGQGLSPIYLSHVVGYHQRHQKLHTADDYREMEALRDHLREEALRTGDWRGGEPWPYL